MGAGKPVTDFACNYLQRGINLEIAGLKDPITGKHSAFEGATSDKRDKIRLPTFMRTMKCGCPTKLSIRHRPECPQYDMEGASGGCRNTGLVRTGEWRYADGCFDWVTLRGHHFHVY